MTILLVVPAMAQPQESCECVFGPKAGQFQFQVNVGTGQFFNDFTGLYYLLPDEDGTATGIGADLNTLETNNGIGNAYISGDLSKQLVNNGSLNFMTRNYSIGMKIFVTDHLNINLSGSYILNMQPSKNFREGETYNITDLSNLTHYDVSQTLANVEPGDIYAQKAILGAVTNRLMLQLGTEWYFNTKNQRIFPYLGVFGQFKMARIESFYPYTGQYLVSDIDMPDMEYEEVDLYRADRGGQALGFGGGINFGVEYALMEGLFIGAEIAPVCYQYTLLHMEVGGQDPYYATNHNLRAFAFPQLTIGVRF